MTTPSRLEQLKERYIRKKKFQEHLQKLQAEFAAATDDPDPDSSGSEADTEEPEEPDTTRRKLRSHTRAELGQAESQLSSTTKTKAAKDVKPKVEKAPAFPTRQQPPRKVKALPSTATQATPETSPEPDNQPQATQKDTTPQTTPAPQETEVSEDDELEQSYWQNSPTLQSLFLELSEDDEDEPQE